MGPFLTDFFNNAYRALGQVAILYVVVALGVLAERLGWFSEETAKGCSKLLLYVVAPCVIFKSFFEMEYSPALLRGMLIAFAGGVFLHLAGIGLSAPFFRGKRQPDTDPILHAAAAYGNVGYMGLPMAQAIVGGEGVFYCSVVIMAFQIFAFTHGEAVMRGRDAGGENQRPLWRRLLLNAGVLSVAIGLPVFLLRLQPPALLRMPIEYVGSLNTPLAMLMFGAYMSRTKLKGILRSRKIFAAAGIKLFAVPALTMAALLLCGVRGDLLTALLISASAPSAQITVIFAAKYGRDSGYAAQVVSLMNFVSIVTMPLMIAIGMTL